MNKSTRRSSAILAFFAFLVAGCTAPDESARTINVVGKATIELAPDHMVVFASVSTVRQDPSDAKNENASIVRSILSFLSDLGVAADDIATGHVRLDKSYSRGQHGEQVFEGFKAETHVRAKVRNLALHERLIEGSLELGLNRIWGITFNSSESVESHREARKLAIRAAREKAEYLAAELGHTVGPALTINEVRPGTSGPWAGNAASNNVFLDRELSSDSAIYSIMPESIMIEEEVGVVFVLKD